ncbi:LOW QUALITY PROTEIN: cilia- and flagella-associated protein 57 [Hippocampus zosterae]|uniref:LOW QUALITY PROTEIN: cilia- and flagella-associated protein 57 n=1 Tax=Hippocampus zosterae TaxID=109293 RepID=UPI00223D5E8B|nr:LOW QUALITY PROTEIN: cilia- and flagella-associated protein 57 [Hippocampus zosterae]
MLQLKAVYGLSTDLRNHLQVVGDRVFYQAGYNVVAYNFREQNQHSAKKQIAMGLVSAEARPAILCQELGHSSSKRRKLEFPELNVERWVSLAFSTNTEFKSLFALSNQEPLLACVSTDKSKGLLGFVRVPTGPGEELLEVKCSSATESITSETVSVLGSRTFKTFKILPETEKSYTFQTLASCMLSLPDPVSDFVTHIWISPGSLEPSLLVASANELYFVDEKGNEIERLPKSLVPAWKDREDPFAVLTQWSQGFLVGGPYGIAVFVYEYGVFKFQSVREIRVREVEQGVRGLEVSEDRVFITTEHSLLLCSKTVELDKYEVLGLAPHTGPITSMDICIKKPLVATACNKDRSIKIWNFEERTVETLKNETESVSCLSFHPSGLHIVVAFTDKLKLMNVNKDGEPEPYKEISQFRNCTDIRFSNGGHMFAAASQSVIYVYRFYLPDSPLKVFKDHVAKIRSLFWSREDSLLVSCANDGTVYGFRIGLENEGRVLNYNPPKEEKTKGGVTACAVIPNEQSIFAPYSCAATGERVVKEIALSGAERGRRELCKAPITQIAFSSTSRIMVVGTEEGFVRSYKMPYSQHQMYFAAHDQRGVEKLRMAHDNKYLFSAGRDGCLLIFEVRDKEGNAERSKEGFGYSREIFVEKKDLEQLKSDEEEKVEIDNTLTSASRDELNALREGLKKQGENWAREYETLMERKKRIEAENREELKAKKDEYDNFLQFFDNSQGKRVVEENAAFDSHKRQLEVEGANNARECKLQQDSYAKVLGDLQEGYERKLEEERGKREDLERRIQHSRRMHHETMLEIQEEQKEEIHNLTCDSKKKEQELTEKALKSKSEMSMIKKRILANKSDYQKHKDEEERNTLQSEQLKGEQDSLRAEIGAMEQVIRAKDDQIAKHEKTIYDYKKKSQELEKFKYVLDHRIKDLKRQIGPREETLTALKVKTNDMDQELKRHNANNSKLAEAVSELYSHERLMKQDIARQRERIAIKSVRIKQFKDQLYQAVQFIQDEQELKRQARDLHAKFVQATVPMAKVDEEIDQEERNQLKFLWNSVRMLKKNIESEIQMHKNVNTKIMRENVLLIKDITDKRTAVREKSKFTKRPESTELKAEVLELETRVVLYRKKLEEIERRIEGFEAREMEID